MAASVYDNLTALIFACLLFVSAVIAVPAIGYVNLLHVDQQQLGNVASEALNSMLLGLGYPSDWGSDFDNVEKFGLALDESLSFYVLDLEKVERLSPLNPSGYLNYWEVRNLLELEDYGFNIRIMPLFNVAVRNMSLGRDLSFNVNVTFNDGRPIPEASVTATMFFVSGNKKDNYTFYTLDELRTDELGKCTIDYQLPSDYSGYILILEVTVADMATITVPYLEGFSQNVAEASIIGDTVTLNIPEEGGPPYSERRVENVTIIGEGEIWSFPDIGGRNPEDKMTWGEGYQYWVEELAGLSYENAAFIIFDIYSQEGPGQKHDVLFVASPLIDIASGALTLKDQPLVESADSAVRFARSIEIAGMTYLFEFLLWKET